MDPCGTPDVTGSGWSVASQTLGMAPTRGDLLNRAQSDRVICMAVSFRKRVNDLGVQNYCQGQA
jgi:hypothetical protein